MRKTTAIAASAGMVLASVVGVGALVLTQEPVPLGTPPPAITIEYLDADGELVSIEPLLATPDTALPAKLLAPQQTDQVIAMDNIIGRVGDEEEAEVHDEHEDEDEEHDDD